MSRSARGSGYRLSIKIISPSAPSDEICHIKSKLVAKGAVKMQLFAVVQLDLPYSSPTVVTFLATDASVLRTSVDRGGI